MVLDTAHHQRGVALADFGHHDADSEAALGAQGAREKIGSVVVLTGGGENAVFGRLWNRVGHSRAVDYQRYGGGRKVQLVRKKFQTHFLHRLARAASAGGRQLFLGRHGAQSRTSVFPKQGGRTASTPRGHSVGPLTKAIQLETG